MAMIFESMRTKIRVEAEGLAGGLYRAEYTCPITDYECNDFKYVVYPNRVIMESQINTFRSAIISVTNHSLECTEFKWQKYAASRMKWKL